MACEVAIQRMIASALLHIRHGALKILATFWMEKSNMMTAALNLLSVTLATAFVTLFVAPAFAAGDHAGGHGHGEAAVIGEPGEASEASRTIEITMHDNYYEPETVSVAKSETVRFVVRNAGELVHDFTIGTGAMHTAHQAEMMMMVEHGALEADRINHEVMMMDMGNGHTMEHNDPNSVLLEPGQTGEVIWQFSEAVADLKFACNVPGHYDAGMTGQIHLVN
jgi:uncharacterized cupredoxin-like copper-binding protein